jgi:hypothetical protein
MLGHTLTSPTQVAAAPKTVARTQHAQAPSHADGQVRERPAIGRVFDLTVGQWVEVRVEVNVLQTTRGIHEREAFSQHKIELALGEKRIAGQFDVGPPEVHAGPKIRPKAFPSEQPAVHPVVADRAGGPEFDRTLEEIESETPVSLL